MGCGIPVPAKLMCCSWIFCPLRPPWHVALWEVFTHGPGPPPLPENVEIDGTKWYTCASQTVLHLHGNLYPCAGGITPFAWFDFAKLRMGVCSGFALKKVEICEGLSFQFMFQPETSLISARMHMFCIQDFQWARSILYFYFVSSDSIPPYLKSSLPASRQVGKFAAGLFGALFCFQQVDWDTDPWRMPKMMSMDRWRSPKCLSWFLEW